MGKCSFSIDFSIPAGEVIATARQAVTGAGGTFTGDTTKGSIDIARAGFEIQADYTIASSTITFTVNKKPFIITCHRIETEVRKYMAPADGGPQVS